MWRCEHNANNHFFFYLPKRKKIYALNNWNNHFFSRMITRVFVSCKQSYLWFIANNDRNMLWEHNADNYFLNLNWNILQLQQPLYKMKMEILMSQCANETALTTMNTMLATYFWILAKTFMHTICRLQREQPVYRFKTKKIDITVHKWNNSNSHILN